MKKILIILLTLTTLVGCIDVLDIEDINNYNPDLVWNDANLAGAYMANLYPTFGNWNARADRTSQQLVGVEFHDNKITITNGDYKNWNYDFIRLVNQAIVDVEIGTLPQDIKDNIKGQSLFFRAYTYFGMVVYHGGVPYIKKPLDRYEDDLSVSRNTTAECFDFMIADLDEAISLLPEQLETTSDDYGKIDGSFALAFKAKVLLYKASPQFNASNKWDNQYWGEAYSVNKKAYDDLLGRGYALIPDYSDVALDERNSEVVFSVINSYPDKTAAWDHEVRPGSESRGPADACPTWEFIKEIPMKDGKMYNDPAGDYYKSEDDFLQTYWENRDPRFEKSIVWNGKNYEISRKAGKRQYTSLGIAHELDDYGINPAASTNSTNLNRYSGFFIVKNSLLDLTQAEVQQYHVDFVLMRFAEVMLNYAETANETGHKVEALDILIQIRERAGINPGDDNKYGIIGTTKEEIREAILAERNIELCFEGHRFWDLRRLRMLDRLDGQIKHGVESIAISENGEEMPMSEARGLADKFELSEVNFKYSLLQVPRTGEQVNLLPEKYYFFPIQQSVMDRNENIEQNVDWGGTFDPTLN